MQIRLEIPIENSKTVSLFQIVNWKKVKANTFLRVIRRAVIYSYMYTCSLVMSVCMCLYLSQLLRKNISLVNSIHKDATVPFQVIMQLANSYISIKTKSGPVINILQLALLIQNIGHEHCQFNIKLPSLPSHSNWSYGFTVISL